jgi:hypothetical protein
MVAIMVGNKENLDVTVTIDVADFAMDLNPLSQCSREANFYN